MYKLHLIKADSTKEVHDYKVKPTFEDMYPLIECDLIQMSTAKIPEMSNRKDGYTDIYFDEEFLGKSRQPDINRYITLRWLEWLENTGRTALPPRVICGNVCVIQEVKDEAA